MTTNSATPMGMTTRSGTRLTRPIPFQRGPCRPSPRQRIQCTGQGDGPGTNPYPADLDLLAGHHENMVLSTCRRLRQSGKRLQITFQPTSPLKITVTCEDDVRLHGEQSFVGEFHRVPTQSCCDSDTRGTTGRNHLRRCRPRPHHRIGTTCPTRGDCQDSQPVSLASTGNGGGLSEAIGGAA